MVSVEYGFAAYYADGVMENVIEIRQQTTSTWGTLPLKKPHVVGYAAVNDCDELGSFVWLCADFECWAGPYWVVDCRNQAHLEEALKRDIEIEVDYDAACRWGARGFGPNHNFVAVVRWEGWPEKGCCGEWPAVGEIGNGTPPPPSLR